MADHDEAGRHANPRILPKAVGLLVVTVEGFESSLELRRQAQGIERVGFASALSRHLRPDMFPQVAEHRHLRAGDVVGHGDARQFDDAALDGVHEREVAHRPREERAFHIAGAAQEKRCGREVDHASDAELALHRLKAGNPQTSGLVVLLGLFLVVPFQVFLVLGSRLLAIAMVGFVVEHKDVLQPH